MLCLKLTTALLIIKQTKQMEEMVVACHCSTCRGEVYQTIRTCQHHVTLYGTLKKESTESQTSFSESEVNL